MGWEATVGGYLSLCICITESRCGWYLRHLSISDLTAPITISPLSGSPSCYLVLSVSQPNPYIIPGVSILVCLLFIVAPHSSYLNNTSLSNSLLRSNGALWEYTLYAKGVGVGSDSAVISVQDIVCIFVCVCMWVGGCVSESIYKGISPGGVDASLQLRESKGGGGELVHSRCSKQPTSLKTSPHLALHCTVHYLFIYFG